MSLSNITRCPRVSKELLSLVPHLFVSSGVLQRLDHFQCLVLVRLALKCHSPTLKDVPGILRNFYHLFHVCLSLSGVLQRLDHFQYIGAEAIWLSPFYTSPMVDFGYDVANFTEVDPMFGTMLDFEELLEEAHAKGRHYLFLLAFGFCRPF